MLEFAGAERAARARGRAQPPARRAVDRVRRAPSAHAVNLRSEQAALEERKRAEIRQIANASATRCRCCARARRRWRPTSTASRARWPSTRSPRSGSSALQRDADADRDLLETYINRAKEIASQQKAQEPDARIISRAVTPDEPTYPRRELIFGVALVGALLARLARGVRARAARQHLPQLGADRGPDRPADARPGAGDHRPRQALRRAAGLCARQPELAVRRGGAQPAHRDAADQHGRAAEDRAADLVDTRRGQDLDGDVPRPSPRALRAAHPDHRLRRAPAAAARADRRRQPEPD